MEILIRILDFFMTTHDLASVNSFEVQRLPDSQKTRYKSGLTKTIS